MDKKLELDRPAQASIITHQKRRSKLFLEAAIASPLESYSVKEVASMLRDHADHLDEFS